MIYGILGDWYPGRGCLLAAAAAVAAAACCLLVHTGACTVGCSPTPSSLPLCSRCLIAASSLNQAMEEQWPDSAEWPKVQVHGASPRPLHGCAPRMAALGAAEQCCTREVAGLYPPAYTCAAYAQCAVYVDGRGCLARCELASPAAPPPGEPELLTGVARLLEARGLSFPALFASYDRDGDGRLDDGELEALAADALGRDASPSTRYFQVCAQGSLAGHARGWVIVRRGLHALQHALLLC